MLLKSVKHDEAKKVINRIIETFRDLNRHQPPEYLVDDYLDVSHNRIIKSVDLLKKGWLKGVFLAWSTVIKW